MAIPGRDPFGDWRFYNGCETRRLHPSDSAIPTDRAAIPPQPLIADPPRYTDRALPPYRFVPGGPWPHPVNDPAGHMHGQQPGGETVLPPERWAEQAGYLFGIDLFNHAFWWEAHEAWEDLWHRTDDPTQTACLHGLIQLAAAMLKWHLRNRRGVRVLLQRARGYLQPVADRHDRYMGLNVADLLKTVDHCGLSELQAPLAEPIILRPH